MNNILLYSLAGTLGILLQIFAVKIPSLKQKYKAANQPFTAKQYWSDDWYTIISSFVSIAICVVCVNEFLAIKPEVAKYLKFAFVFVGFTGSSIIQQILSVANKKVMAVIDIKTNIADNVSPVINKDNEIGAAAIAKANMKA